MSDVSTFERIDPSTLNLKEQVVSINRGTKVVKGGKNGIPLHTVTEYDLVLKRPGGGELVLPRHQFVREPEYYGLFAHTTALSETVRAYAGASFTLQGRTYTVIAISPHGARLAGDRGEHYTLQLRPQTRKPR